MDETRIVDEVVSGGQTGVDRAGLDAAIVAGLRHGGWCPRGRRAEDGPIPARYTLRETPERDYAVRTERNVCDSDGTLIVAIGAPTGGTALTRQLAEQHGKPCCVVDLADPAPPAAVRQWITTHRIRTLNVAGPRESSHPGVHRDAFTYLRHVLA